VEDADWSGVMIFIMLIGCCDDDLPMMCRTRHNGKGRYTKTTKRRENVTVSGNRLNHMST
jgi:hypothetical protein